MAIFIHLGELWHIWCKTTIFLYWRQVPQWLKPTFWHIYGYPNSGIIDIWNKPRKAAGVQTRYSVRPLHKYNSEQPALEVLHQNYNWNPRFLLRYKFLYNLFSRSLTEPMFDSLFAALPKRTTPTPSRVRTASCLVHRRPFPAFERGEPHRTAVRIDAAIRIVRRAASIRQSIVHCLVFY